MARRKRAQVGLSVEHNRKLLSRSAITSDRKCLGCLDPMVTLRLHLGGTIDTRIRHIVFKHRAYRGILIYPPLPTPFIIFILDGYEIRNSIYVEFE